MANALLTKKKRWIEGSTKMGFDMGVQFAADMITLSLNDKAVMGKSAMGARRIRRILEDAMERAKGFDQLLDRDVESDYQQELLDRQMAAVFGPGNVIPFRERYPYVGNWDYSKRAKRSR